MDVGIVSILMTDLSWRHSSRNFQKKKKIKNLFQFWDEKNWFLSPSITQGDWEKKIGLNYGNSSNF